VLRQPPTGPPKPLSEFTREELLWLYRTNEEEHHRLRLHYSQLFYPFQSLISVDKQLCDINGPHWYGDSCNKTVPVYFLEGGPRKLVATIMENYIYRRWFRPYRSEIDADQFACRFIMPKGLPPGSGPASMDVVMALVKFNSILCEHVSACTQKCTERESTSFDANLATSNDIPSSKSRFLNPIFQALLIIVPSDEYKNEDSTTVGRFPVVLFRTGIEDGLHAPISFKSIAPATENAVLTTLETAVDFVMALEAREAAVFGIWPDPTAIAKIKTDENGNELTRQPSSQWVSDEKAAEWGWLGRGRQYDDKQAATLERRGRGTYKLHVLEQRIRSEGWELPDSMTVDGVTAHYWNC